MPHRPFSSLTAPPWEVLALVGLFLGPKTLAIASCVCKSWFVAFSSDQLWQPICYTHFPTITNLRVITHSSVAFFRIYAIAHKAAKLRLQTPSEPRLSLDNLIYAVNIRSKNSDIVSLAKPCEELVVDPNGMFKFDMNVNYDFSPQTPEDVKITWNVILKGWGGLFTMMDFEGKVSFAPGSEAWFSEELPSPGCCSSAVASGVMSDLKLVICSRKEMGGGKVRAGKLHLGILCIVSWRYVSLGDGLRYLQHFLLPREV